VIDDEDAIWNRACDPFSHLAGTGDRALQALLLVHGQVMNGGLASSLEYQSADQIQAAISGFEYFGRSDIGAVLRAGMETAFPAGVVEDPEAREDHMLALDDETSNRLERLDDAYNALVPRDEVLVDMFRDRLRTSPRDFAEVP
jgi:hypothetical protein